MRVQTDTYNVYEFKELSKEAQEEALEYFRQSEHFDFLADDMAEKLDDLLKQYKLKYDEMPKTYFSLSYCQGDGAMFEGTVYYKSYTVDITHSGNYYHYNSKQIDMYSTKTSKGASGKVFNEFNELYVDLCIKLERYGYDVMESTLEDSNLVDIIEANEYEFLESGKLI
jgi:hypothetical protein